jgi:acyl carrier protein
MLESKLIALIASMLHVDQAVVRLDATIAGDLAADSLDMVS